jgi:hypothetical protein
MWPIRAMRIAISGTAGIAALLITASAVAQAPGPAPIPTTGDKPEPLPVLPTMPAAQRPQPAVTSATPAPPTAAPTQPAKPAKPRPKPPANLDAPPAPPPAGLAPPPPAPVQPPPFTSESASQAVREPPFAGWSNGFFIRDPGDYFRFYPRGRLHLDFHSFPGAPVPAASEGGTALQPRFFARRLRLELSGEAFKRWTFTFGVDFGGQPLVNTDGASPVVTTNPGENTTSASGRYAQVEAIGSTPFIANAFINYSFCPCFNIMVGQQQAPFGIENRTNNNVTTFMERNLPIRGFVAPNAKEIGLTLWGDLLDDRLSYELGVYAGDGQNRPQIDAHPDFIGRVFTRPLLGGKSPLEKLQLGVSGRAGNRDQKFVGYDYQPIATAQGWSLWEPRYTDALGRTIHVIPSGMQAQIGGELRVPISMLELRGEAYWVSNDTREAVEGFQLTNTERLGRMSGAGWYVQASVWPLGDRFVNGDPGMWRPHTVSLTAERTPPERGLEVVALVGGINADYQGASRGGVQDPNTPSVATSSKIDIFEYGFALNYWYTRHLRASVNYILYHTPGSGSAANLAKVPSNVVGPSPSADEHLLHELGARIGIGF